MNELNLAALVLDSLCIVHTGSVCLLTVTSKCNVINSSCVFGLWQVKMSAIAYEIIFSFRCYTFFSLYLLSDLELRMSQKRLLPVTSNDTLYSMWYWVIQNKCFLTWIRSYTLSHTLDWCLIRGIPAVLLTVGTYFALS